MKAALDEPARGIGVVSIVAAVVAAAICVWLYDDYGGPGDQVFMFMQAADLIPFTHNWYGPSYFVGLRIVRELTGAEWFTTGKLLSFLSFCVYLAICAALLRKVLAPPASWLAVALVALNPEVIASGFNVLNVGYGAVWILAAVLVVAKASPDSPARWLVAGVLFGAASLVRTQALAFLLGAIAGIVFLPGGWRPRLRAAVLLAMGAAAPRLAWMALLMAVQGSVPEDWNFVHVAAAITGTRSFSDVTALHDRYGSMWGVLTADPGNIPRLGAHVARAVARFPVRDGLQLLGLAAVWLIPGALAALLRRATYAPWFTALVAGFVATTVVTPAWTYPYYHIPALPLFAFLIATALEAPGRDRSPALVRLGWGVVLVSTAVWSALVVPRTLRDLDWPEWRVARDYLNVRTDSSTVVSATASSLMYGARFRYLDFDHVMVGRDSDDFVGELRRRGVAYLVVSERHSLEEYPSQAALLADSIAALPAGLTRDTLITLPRRVAVFRLVP